MSWNPLDWFNNRGGGSPTSWSNMYESGMLDKPMYESGILDKPFNFNYSPSDDGGSPTSWSNMYKSGMLDKPFYSSESPSFVNQFGKGFLQEYMNNDKRSKENAGGGIGWLGGGKQGGFTTTPIGKSGRNTLVQAYHPQATVIPAAPSQRSGSGIGGLIGSGLGYFVGNAIAPGIGGKIGGSIGGSIGSSF
jgi:hypothetical protein